MSIDTKGICLLKEASKNNLTFLLLQLAKILTFSKFMSWPESIQC